MADETLNLGALADGTALGDVTEAPEATRRRARLAVCDRATDPDDARDLLAMLGLLDTGPLRSGGGPATKPFVHGTKSGVDAHQDGATPLCGACQTWQDVQDRREERLARQADGVPEPERGNWPTCGTRSGYERHRERREPACAACKAAKSAYQTQWAARHPEYRKRQAGKRGARGVA